VLQPSEGLSPVVFLALVMSFYSNHPATLSITHMLNAGDFGADPDVGQARLAPARPVPVDEHDQ
jgi:hypothetical protein